MKYSISESGKFKVINIEGDLLVNKRYEEINKEILRLIEAGHHHFVFNLEKLSCIDSSGISVFIHCLCDVQENGGSIFLIVPDASVREVIELVGLNRLIKTYNNVSEFEKSEIKSN